MNPDYLKAYLRLGSNIPAKKLYGLLGYRLDLANNQPCQKLTYSKTGWMKSYAKALVCDEQDSQY